MDKITGLYSKKDYSSLIQYCLSNLDSLSEVDEYYLGLSLFEMGYKDSAYSLLTGLVNYDVDNSIDISKVLCYLGLIEYSFGRHRKAASLFKKSILQESDFSTEAEKWARLLHIEAPAQHSSKNIQYHFIDVPDKNDRDRFINKYEHAFERVQLFFQAKLAKCVDVFVYNGRKDILGNNLSYANPSLSTIHVFMDEDSGHELTHIASSYTEFPITFKSRFISEGVAEYFDATIKINQFVVESFDLFDIWLNFEKFDIQFSYAIAKIFISHIITISTREAFLSFYSAPSIENAKIIFGEKFYEAKKATELEISKLKEMSSWITM